MSLLPVAEAQARLLALATLLPVETVSLVDAAGRWAASDIAASRTQPAADLSMMDGYAIRFADLPGPWRVIGESRAGASFDGVVESGQATRIFTGAPVPGGAVDNNRVQANTITTKGLPGVALHSHVPGQDLNGNVIWGNVIGTNNILGAEAGDAETTGVFIGSQDPVSITVQGNVITENHFGVFTAGR
jgi:hypothetical protein